MGVLVNPSRFAVVGGGAMPGGVSWPFWLRASTLAQADTSAITSWPDLGTGNTPASGGGGAVYRTGVMGTNARPAASFNGSSHYMASARNASSRPRTLVVVAQFTDFTTRTMIGNSTGSGGRSFRGHSSHADLLDSQVALIGSNTSTLSAATPYILAVTVDGSGNWAMRVNNAASGSGSGGAAFTASRTSLIGASTSPVASVIELMSGYIAEILEADTVLSSGDLDAVYADLSAYYGI